MFRRAVICVALLAATPAAAQVRPAPYSSDAGDDQDDEQPVVQQPRLTPLDGNRAARTAQSSAGEVGQRQTRDTAATQAGIQPMARIASRIQNRVQNRLRTRIDRNYNPDADTSTPFAVAEEQVSRPRRGR